MNTDVLKFPVYLHNFVKPDLKMLYELFINSRRYIFRIITRDSNFRLYSFYTRTFIGSEF